MAPNLGAFRGLQTAHSQFHVTGDRQLIMRHRWRVMYGLGLYRNQKLPRARRDGYTINLYDDGTICRMEYFVCGVLHGTRSEWRRDGSLHVRRVYNNGRCHTIMYGYPDGTIIVV